MRNEILQNAKKLHFVGIGGISMSSLALLARRAGYLVSGSDRSDSALVEECRKAGCKITLGHFAESVEGADAVIYTAAVSLDSPELKRASELSIPCFSRAEFLGEVMLAYPCRIGVSGTHGKTTTTSMTAHILIDNQKDPTVANGAVSAALGGSALRVGGEDFFVYEACEYKASFHSFFPTVAIITNVELDHTDYYTSLAHITDSFRTSLKDAEVAIVNGDDENALEAASDFSGRLIRFSLKDETADYFAKDIAFVDGRGRFTLCQNGREVSEVSLPMIGHFNIANALAAIAATSCCGVSLAGAAESLKSFGGAARRFEFKFKQNGITVFDDYAHHPSEIAATLAGAKHTGAKRIITVFQPHTYSRTHDLFDGFVGALSASDVVILPDIYAARETDTLGVSSEKLANAIGEKAMYMKSFEEIAAYLAKEAREGDLILTMGAGDVYKIGNLLKEALAK
ncbi:MAG: UDP-N-acetylmuramate--L-alanine ligase [Clostridia bacterium]|nr:UDP-N-acetylmuramate--L-alanine ligase [Clostridia bacterium]